jgi:hypothetical protein
LQDENKNPSVFISYSHDSPEHARRVLGLSERLRQGGVETILDRYINGTPQEGWPRWMLNQIDEADFVLLICTETYYRRFRGHEQPDKGKGADWEGTVITQEIYDSRSRTNKFVPVLLYADSQRFIPEPVRSHTNYPLNSEQAYQNLYDFLLGQSGIEPGMLGTPLRKTRKQVEPLTFPDENMDSQNPDHVDEAPTKSVTAPNRTAHRQNPSPIPQDPIETLDDRGYLTKLKKELTKCLSNEKLHPLISELVNNPGRSNVESAVDTLLSLEPLVSLRRWTEITAVWFKKDLNPRERSAAWDAVRDVHLSLLTRVVDPGWLQDWKKNSHDNHDKRLLIISLKPRSQNRSVEVLVARVDAKCGMVRFSETEEAASAQAHAGQINTMNEALRGMQKPTTEEAVQRLGRYLLAQYRPDEEPPNGLQTEDWEDLNDYIVESPAGLFHYYYLLIQDDDPDYGNDTALRLLYEKMPNLPRILLSKERGTDPLICRQNRLEAVIDAFWDIRRMEFA